LAESNPEAAQRALDAGTFDKYFTSGQMQTARRYVEQQARLTTTLVKTQNKEASDADMANIQNTTIDPEYRATDDPEGLFRQRAGLVQQVAEQARGR
jgi:hypothetical protein